MRSGANHTHVSLEHIDELGKLINTATAHHRSEGENALIAQCRLLHLLPSLAVHLHRAKLEDLEAFLAQATTELTEKERSGGLSRLHDHDPYAEERQHQKHNRK